MKHSLLQDTNPTRDYIDSFGGYNHNLQINDNEFYDTQNLTSDNYPVLSPRRKRGKYREETESNTYDILFGNNYLVGIKGSKLYDLSGSTDVELDSYAGAYIPQPEQIVAMGSYLIVLPNKRYVNLVDPTDKGYIEKTYTSTSGATVTFTLCQSDATAYSGTVAVQSVAPNNPQDKALWIDTSESKHILKQYSADSGMWIQVPTTYVKISANGIGAGFSEGDGVKISGIKSTLPQLPDLNDKTSILHKVYHDAETPANDYIVVVGIADVTSSQTVQLTVSRSMPDMDFIIESGNRLWGCKYGNIGTAQNPVYVNEIYASKLGDFKNWNCFAGISTDSYVASVGEYDAFTGAISYLGNPLFFKENTLYKVYGTMPSNFQISKLECPGVQKGSARSLAVVKNKLFYKSRSGVMAYDGSLPVDISYAFGGINYSAVGYPGGDNALFAGATGCGVGDKYYINMKSEKNNEWYLFSYDTSKGIWHKESTKGNGHILGISTYKDELYMVFQYNPLIVWSVNGTGTLDTNPVEWYAETGIITYPYTKYGSGKSPDNKYISKINIRMSLDIGATVRFYCQYDSTGEWEHIYTMTGTTLRSFTIPIRPKRCDHLRLRIEGVGDAKIYSIAKTFEQGSDVV